MKKCFYIILAFLSIKIVGQNKELPGTWISKNNDLIKIKEPESRFNVLSTIDNEEQLNLRTVNDSLSFYTQYTKVGSDQTFISEYNFYIKKLTQSKLILVPTSQFSKDFYKNRKEISFTKQEFNIDKSISFEKLIYHTTSCHGTCPVINLEIDKKKNIYINREIFNDKINSGNFVGTLSEESYNKLIKILQTTNIKTWSFPQKEGHDAPTVTLILYYNGKRKYFKSMFPPTISQQLINLLNNISENKDLIRTNKDKKLER